jgi:hypothetical protein
VESGLPLVDELNLELGGAPQVQGISQLMTGNRVKAAQLYGCYFPNKLTHAADLWHYFLNSLADQLDNSPQ